MERQTGQAERSRILRQTLMAQLRDTRRRIDPELLAYARRTIENRAANDGAALADGGVRPSVSDAALPIDRRKNMATILKFLELTAGNRSLGHRVQEMFADRP